MKSIWSGTISFGLVQIPVKLFSAIESHSFGFNVLHAKCNTQLAYERWCPRCQQKVTWQDTVKGLPASDGTYYVFTQETLAQLKPTKTESIDIIYFVDRLEIPDIYFDSHYYIAPEKKTAKSFFLFLEALDQAGLVAIGRFVMRDKEYMCALEPYEKGMLLTTLNYEYEIRSMADIPFKVKAPALTKSEVTLAKQLIAKMTKKKFDISKYKDTFIEKLKKSLKTKKPTRPQGDAKKSTKKEVEKTVRTPHKEDLITALRTSLHMPAQEKASAYAKATKKTRRKSAPPKTKLKVVAKKRVTAKKKNK